MAGRRNRIWLLFGVAGALLVVGLTVGPLMYARLQDDPPAAATVQAQPEGSELSTQTDGRWLVSEGSLAGYRVDEVLNGADVTVAGSTQEVTGSVVVVDGEITTAEVAVDVASVTTDSERRDSYFRDDVMAVEHYPLATFQVTDPVRLPELSGTPVVVPVSGQLTVAGTSRPVEVDLSVVRTSTGVDVSGSIPIVFADYGIEAPDLGFVRVEDEGAVELFLRLTMSS